MQQNIVLAVANSISTDQDNVLKDELLTLNQDCLLFIYFPWDQFLHHLAYLKAKVL